VKPPPPADTTGGCPSCNRYTGPVPVCPYCDTRIPLPAALRLIRAAALLLASAGLLALWIASARLHPSSVRIGDIRPAMNGARLRVAGRVAGAPRGGREPGSLSFGVDDGSGRLRVYAGADAAPSAHPSAGDTVSVTGTLKISAGRDPVLFVRSPAHITVTAEGARGEPPE